ncbi:MAG TPA: cytochrome c maturation protein CcmE [Chloroflexota bacterium]|nr:cytochrome c maturation protein CcmE [Chloroflexota bacterium]
MSASVVADRSSGDALQQLQRRRTRLPQRRFAVGGLIIVVAVGYLIMSSFSSAVASVMSPSELLRHGATPAGQTIRLQGKVVGADRVDPRSLAHIFSVSDGRASVIVAYASDLPGGFKTGASVEAQGTYDGHRFTASSLTAKCPTKYQAAGSTSQ